MQKLKSILLILSIFILSMNSNANMLIDKTELLTDIKLQVEKLQSHIDEIGRSNIAASYFIKLKESHYALSQLKAEAIELKQNLDEIVSLSSTIEQILNIKSLESNSAFSMPTKGTGNAIIRGVVSSSETGFPAANHWVRLYDSNGVYLQSNYSDSQGRYIFNNLVAGQYTTIAISSFNEFVTTAQPNISCAGGLGSGCLINELPLITLAENQILEQVNISILSSPTISGKVVNTSNNSIRYSEVSIYNENGELIRTTSTNYFGEYTIALPQSGNYYIRAAHSSYLNQFYDNLNCETNCDLNLATLLEVSDNEHIEYFDFTLNQYSSINGTLVDADTNLALTSGGIYLYNTNNQLVNSTSLYSNHQWTLSNVSPGNYRIVSTNNNYLATVYNEIACLTTNTSSCNINAGQILIHAESDTIGIELKQKQGTTIKGTVKNFLNQPISNARIYLYDSYGNNLDSNSIYTDSIGRYETNSVNNGNYYLIASDYYYQTELYPDIECNNFNCDFNLGTQVIVSNLNTVNNIDFTLNRFGSISGTVTSSLSSPLSNVRIYISNIDDSYYNSNYSNEFGEFSFSSLPVGSYKLYAKKQTYVSQSFAGIDCNDDNCIGESFTEVVVDDDDTNSIDFQLNKKGIVNFSLNSNSINPVDNGYIEVFDSSNNFINRYNYNHTITLDRGDYYFKYLQPYGDQHFVSKVYGGENCFNDCLANTGLLVSIENNDELQLSMNLDEYFYLDINFDSPAERALLIYDDNFNEINHKSFYNTNHKIYVNTSENILLKFQQQGFYDYLYENINCVSSSCDLSQATSITPQLNSSVSVSINLTKIASLSGNITNSDGTPIVGATVSITDIFNNNLYYSSVTTSINGEYEFTSLPLGTYHLKAYSYEQQNYAETYYGNLSCEFSCENINLPTVSFDEGDYLTDYNISLNNRGSLNVQNILGINGEFIDSELRVYRFTPPNTLSHYNSRAVSEDGTVANMYLPEGSYKILVKTNNYPYIYSTYPNGYCNEGQNSYSCAALSSPIEILNDNHLQINQFIVHQRGKVQGQIRDETSNSLLNNISVRFYEINNGFNYLGTSTNNGRYSYSLPSGQYRVYTEGNNYLGQLYNNINCGFGLGVDCILNEGEVIVIDVDTNLTIDFDLSIKPGFKINFMDLASQNTIASNVKIYDQGFHQIYSGTSNISEPQHLINNLYPGNYYILAEGYDSTQHSATAFPNINCDSIESINSCSASLNPMPLLITDGQKIVNFGSLQNQGINGYLVDDKNGEPLENIIIDIWDNTGLVIGSSTTSSSGGFSYQLNQGDYYVTTDTNSDYTNEIYNNILCETAAILGNCDVTQGELITIPENNSVPIVINIGLDIDPIYSNGFD